MFLTLESTLSYTRRIAVFNIIDLHLLLRSFLSCGIWEINSLSLLGWVMGVPVVLLSVCGMVNYALLLAVMSVVFSSTCHLSALLPVIP